MLDVVDDMGCFVAVKPRDAVHLDGDWHRVFHCQIVAERDGVGVAVLQQRSPADEHRVAVADAGHLWGPVLDRRQDLAVGVGERYRLTAR